MTTVTIFSIINDDVCHVILSSRKYTEIIYNVFLTKMLNLNSIKAPELICTL